MSVEGSMNASLERLVVELCADYQRRKAVIENKRANVGVIMECRFLNYRILSAAQEIAGFEDAPIFIYEIGERIGYARSSLFTMSERTYKERKEEVKRNIARRLSLI